MFLLLAILVSIQLSNGHPLEYNVTYYNNPILYEHFGNGYLYNDIWQTLHFFDISEIWRQTGVTLKQVENLTLKCQQYKNCTMINNLRDIKTNTEVMVGRVATLLQLTASRKKRGLINAVGTGLHYLFGTMDNDDAESIAHTLNNVYNHSSNTILLVKNQTTIVKNLLNTIAIDEKLHEESLNKLHDIASALQAQQFNEIVLQEAFRLNLNIFAINNLLSAIENSIQADRTGLISPLLITPKTFIESLEKINKVKPKDKQLLAIHIRNYHLFMKLSSVSILLYDNKLVYKIDTPIPLQEKYNVIKITSLLTTKLSIKYFMYSNLANKEMLVSEDNHEYTIVNLDRCKILYDKYYCKIHSLINRVDTNLYLTNILKNIGIGCEKKWLTIDYSIILNLKEIYTSVIFFRNF